MKHIQMIHQAFKVPASYWKGDGSLAQQWGLQYSPAILKELILVYWKKPPESWVKLNTDASVSSSSHQAAVAGIIRCSNGRTLKIFQHILGRKTPYEAEMFAIMKGLTLCRTMGLPKVMVEADAQAVIQSLNHDTEVTNWRTLYTLQQIKSCTRTMEVTFQHIHREGNSVADNLAKEALSLKLNREVPLGVCNPRVKQLIYSDNTGIPYLRIPK